MQKKGFRSHQDAFGGASVAESEFSGQQHITFPIPESDELENQEEEQELKIASP